METFKEYPTPRSKQDVINMLSDQSNVKHPVFGEQGHRIVTLAVGTKFCLYNFLNVDLFFFLGIFDCIERTWILYAGNPKKNKPLIVLPLDIKSN